MRTSFRSLARHPSQVEWRRLHKGGVYVIWLAATASHFHSVSILFHRVVFTELLAPQAGARKPPGLRE